MADLVGGAVGRYEVRRLVRAYATDAVYEAWDPLVGRLVFLKVANEVDGRVIGARLVENEARILARLEHPGILRLYDAGRDGDGRFWFAAEHLPGGSLREVLAAPPDDPRPVLEVLVAVGEALGFLHRRGFVHRNVQPGTIHLDEEGKPRVVGLSLAAEAEESAENVIRAFVAKVAYASPEELSGAAVGPPSDVWSLGVLLHELLAGSLPFGPEAADRMREGRPVEPAPLPRRDPIEPTARLEAVVRRCLATDPAERYEDASRFSEALRAALAGTGEAGAVRAFVSHSFRDREFVEREVVSPLEREGVRTWYAKSEIRSAQQWDRTILRGLESCPWFLLVMSPRSAASDWVRDELFWAMENRPQGILPVLAETCNPWDFHLRLARIQHVDFTKDLPAAHRELLQRLRSGP